MKKIKFLSLVALLLIAIQAQSQEVRPPSYIVDGKTYAFVSSENEHAVEKELSEYVERNLPIIRYDNSSFRLVVSATIGNTGQLKRLRLVNKKSLKGNMAVWTDVKKIINAVHFKPAMFASKPVSHSFVFQIKVDFTKAR